MVYCLSYNGTKMQVHIGNEPIFIYREALLGCLLYNMEQDRYDKEYTMSTIKELKMEIPRKAEFDPDKMYMSKESALQFRDYYKSEYNPYFAKKNFKKSKFIKWC